MEKVKTKILKLKEEFERIGKKENKKDFNLKNINLRPYQEDGIKWLIERYGLSIGCILADDMGLGKTAQTIGLIVHALKDKPKGKILILSPLSVIHNWQQEIERFTENIDYLLYVGAKEERAVLNKRVLKQKFEIMLTTYELCLKDEELLSAINWSVLVVDEGHRLKNSNTQLFKSLEEFNIEQRVLLTGTPIQNNLQELYSLLSFIQPNLFKLRYGEEFCERYKTSDEKLLNELTQLLQPFVLRRIKSQVNINLPTRYECILYHNLTKLQKQLYKSILTKNLDVFTGANKKVRLVSVLMNLRKIALHPYLMPNIEPEPFELGDHLFNTSGKFSLLDKLLDYLFNNKHKVLLFSQFTCVLDIVQDYLSYKNYNYERIDGSVRGEERNIAIKNFNAKQDVFIFLLSTRAGGVGLNLVSADTCIFMDNDFNPHNDLQAAARIHRIGQQKPTMIIRLICKSTVEEIIYKRAEVKLKLANDIIENGQLANNLDLVKSNSSTIQNELCEILKFGLNDLFEESDENLDEEVDFNKLLAPTSNDGVWLIDEKLKEKKKLATASPEEKLEEEEEPKTIYEFEGKDYSKELFNEEDEKKLKDLIKQNKIVENDEETVIVGKRKRVVDQKEDPEELKLRLEREKIAKKQKLEEKHKNKDEALKQKWKENSYKSLKLENDENIDIRINDIIENESNEDVIDIDTKLLNYVTGDVTKLKHGNKTNKILIHCVDNSGRWGRGGLFDALVKRKSDLPDIYKEASKMDDINLGDVHFINLNENNEYLALIVAQKRDKNGYLGELSIKLVESAFKQIFLKAIELKNTTVHLPRIGHNTPNFNWYAIERLIKKYFSNLKVPTYIYYFKRQSEKKSEEENSSDSEDLPDIFKNFNFYFYNFDKSVQEGLIDFKQIKRYIVAFNGIISSVLTTDVTHIILNEDDDLDLLKNELKTNKIEKGTCVKYKWLELCLLKKKLIEIEKFIIEI